ncbi:reverse transcriptase-like protein [Elysia marginata]|uniref:Reverse transcriptase-like protein n=1 Tax=Elysia marginata TaxID=1093978 RepID=A0AAV4FFQ0_9GAST|nr:reverse transcriptase-like protein [Elysia marginata]
MVNFASEFDKVWKAALHHKMAKLNIPKSCIEWVKTLLWDRRAEAEFDNTENKYKLFRNGLPQEVLSPTLLLINIKSIDENIAENCETSLFGDDLAFWTSGESIKQAERKMQKP